MIKTREMDLEYLNYIPKPASFSREELYGNATRNDAVTVKSWRKTWLDNARENKKRFGSFKDQSIGKIYKKYVRQPVICQGSGPSLRNNIHELQNTKDIPIISCLHNYHYNVDNGVNAQYYVSLDAGEITVSEIGKGGKENLDYYYETTKDKTLLAYVGTSPRLLERWQGEILFFQCPVPDEAICKEMKEIENFNAYVSSGGNVLGACVYIAKAFMGCNPIAFVGADFCFNYKKEFHPWVDENYADVGHAVRLFDVYGNKVLSWQSYVNFKNFFEWLAMTVPGIYINCTEGGALGSYPEGNIQDIKQMDLAYFKKMYSLHEDIEHQVTNPEKDSPYILY